MCDEARKYGDQRAAIAQKYGEAEECVQIVTAIMQMQL